VDVVLQEEVVQLLPMVNEANAMSDELKKNAQFELALITKKVKCHVYVQHLTLFPC
jgi:hypothetical protein